MTDNNIEKIIIKVHSATCPDKKQEKLVREALEAKYSLPSEFVWCEDESIKHGFKVEVGNEIYDWTAEARINQLRDKWIKEAKNASGKVIPLMRDSLNSWVPEALAEQIGKVKSVGDNIAVVDGLYDATYGEILLFEDGTRGMVLDLKRDTVGCVLFGDDENIAQGSTVRRTGKTAGIPAGEEYLGRVIDALGNPIDGLGEIKAQDYRPIESPAPGIVDRQPVNQPMETGILAIDAMFPIGRGQRELIIGDRQTGKTAIALDTILNQKGKDVICIYVAIGQKSSSVAQLTEVLRRHDALPYTIVVCSTASDADPLQYIAPYAGCAMAEYFMEKGRDVLIVYDDLSKHAIAYRALSLLLGRSPGREAYPGDVFYLHSRLLERSAHLSDAKGGGSITALPIVETQAGDVSAYIPTNIISITDGQIFLESNLFFSGQRPAINIGLSVSRVGSSAQTKAMKKATGAIRLDLAQYREMEVFTQFASDLDDETKARLKYGQGLMMLLRQSQYKPKSQHEQVITLVSAQAHVFQDIEPMEIRTFRKEMINYFESSAKELCERIDHTGLLNEDDKQEIISISKSFANSKAQ